MRRNLQDWSEIARLAKIGVYSKIEHLFLVYGPGFYKLIKTHYFYIDGEWYKKDGIGKNKGSARKKDLIPVDFKIVSEDIPKDILENILFNLNVIRKL